MNCPLKARNGNLLLIEFAMRCESAMEHGDLPVHVDSCPSCQSFIAQQRQVYTALDAWTANPSSADFDAKLFARFEKESGDTWIRRLWRNMDQPVWMARPALPLGIAALLVAGFVTGDPAHWMTTLRGRFQASPAPVVAAAVIPDPAAQLDQALDDLQLLDQLDAVKRRAHRGHARPL